MWIVKGIAASGGREIYYTGRAGEGWVSEDLEEAFGFDFEDMALYKAELFNRRTTLHGIYFNAKEV